MEDDEAGVKFENLGTPFQEADCCSSCWNPPIFLQVIAHLLLFGALVRGISCSHCDPSPCLRQAEQSSGMGRAPAPSQDTGCKGAEAADFDWNLEFQNRSLRSGKGFLAVPGRGPCRFSREPSAHLTTLSLSWTAPWLAPFPAYTLKPNLPVT